VSGTIFRAEELQIQGGGADRHQDQCAAGENQAQTNDLVPQEAAILFHIPDAVESHFERNENAVRRKQQQKHR